ncbi:MAG: phosphoglycerate kinase, partial [Candidatus Omnitrophica bacterium]|nr:phosphoglycerate kinase [Candidatus Omnitrophota bacterium]
YPDSSESKPGLPDKGIAVGSQEVTPEEITYTGAVPPSLLRRLGVKHVIIGHKEQRQRGETPVLLNQKLRSSLRAELEPTFCLGAENSGNLAESLQGQLREILLGATSQNISEIIFAYEPYGTVGRGAKTASTDDIGKAVSAGRQFLQSKYGSYVAEQAAIIYGGSVDLQNVKPTLEVCDGSLIGRQSLKPQELASLFKLSRAGTTMEIGLSPERLSHIEVRPAPDKPTFASECASYTAVELVRSGYRGKALGLDPTIPEENAKKEAIKKESDGFADDVYRAIACALRKFLCVYAGEGTIRDKVKASGAGDVVNAKALYRFPALNKIFDWLRITKTIIYVFMDVIEGTNAFVTNVFGKLLGQLKEWESGATSTFVTGSTVKHLGKCPDYYVSQIFTKVAANRQKEFETHPLNPNAETYEELITEFRRLAAANNQTLKDYLNNFEVVLLNREREARRIANLEKIKEDEQAPRFRITLIEDGTVAHGLLAVFGQADGRHKMLLTIGGASEGFMILAVGGALSSEGAVGALQICSQNVNKAHNLSMRLAWRDEERSSIREQRKADAEEVLHGKIFTTKDAYGDLDAAFSFITNNGVFNQEGVKENGDGTYAVNVLRIQKSLWGRPRYWIETVNIAPGKLEAPAAAAEKAKKPQDLGRPRLVKQHQKEFIRWIKGLGGKICNSIHMVTGKVPVPPLFGVSDAGAMHFYDHTPGLLGEITAIAMGLDVTDTSAGDYAENTCKRLITDAELPKDMGREMEEACLEIAEATPKEKRAYFKEGKDLEAEFIDRSSQGLEDLPGIPSAGIGDSIPSMGIKKAVYQVWQQAEASKYNRRAFEYRDKCGWTFWVQKAKPSDIAEVVRILRNYLKNGNNPREIEVAGKPVDIEMLVTALEKGQYISTLRMLKLFELASSLDRDSAAVKNLIGHVKSLREDFVNPRSIGGGVQIQMMRSSVVSVVSFSVMKATGWTGFTTGNFVIVFSATYGRGELIVQGKVIPDTFVFLYNPNNEHYVMLEKKWGTKDKRLIRKLGGEEELENVPDEERNRFCITDEQAFTVAKEIMNVHRVHNAGKKDLKHPVPVDVEACFFKAKDGKLRFEIVQKRDVEVKKGFDFENPEIQDSIGTLVNSNAAEEAIKENLLVARGFATQNAASGRSFWVEQVPHPELFVLLKEIRDGKASINDLRKLIPPVHNDIFTDTFWQEVIDDVEHTKQIVSSGIQQDLNVAGLDFNVCRSIENIIKKVTAPEELDRAVRDDATIGSAIQDKTKLITGLKKLYRFESETQGRIRLFYTIFRINRINTDLSEELIKQQTDKLAPLILNMQFDKIKAILKKGERLILCTTETNPNFNDIMFLVDENGGGTLTFQGGNTSHAIVVAVQFGICVVAGVQFTREALRTYPNIINEIKEGKDITLDGNEGRVFLGALAIDEIMQFNQAKKWLWYGGDIGLICGAPLAMQRNSKLAFYQVEVDKQVYLYAKKASGGAYLVSLDRIEEALLELGVDFRAAIALDRLMKIDAGKLRERDLDERQLADVRKISDDTKEQENLRAKAQGFSSPYEFIRFALTRHFLQMLALTPPGQITQVRQRDFKKREIIETLAGARLYYNDEEASMIGDRGIGLEVRDENIEALDLQFWGLSDAIQEAEYIGGLGDIGFMFVFVRKPSLLQKALDRWEQLYLESKKKLRFPKEIGVMYELTSNAIFAHELAKILVEFKHRLKEKYGIEIGVYFSNGTNDMTQSVKGSRDEARYVQSKIYIPTSKDYKPYRVFYEGDQGVIDNILHGIVAAHDQGVKAGLCGQAMINLLQIGTPEAIAAAKKIVAYLDSVGTGFGTFSATVSLRADAQLYVQFIPDVYAQRAVTILTAKSLSPRGAALRRAAFIRSYQDLAFTKDIGRKERLIAKVAEGEIIILAPGIRESIDAIKDEKIKKQYQKLFTSSLKAASGIILVNGKENDSTITFCRQNDKAVMLSKEAFDKLKDQDIYAFDFARGKVYAPEGVAFDREELKDTTCYASVDYNAKPKTVDITTVSMDEIYQALGIHPLALIVYEMNRPKTRFSESQNAEIERTLKQLFRQLEVSEDDVRGMCRDVEEILRRYHVESVPELIYTALNRQIESLGTTENLFLKTSGEDVRFFNRLKWGKKLEMEVVNGPIDFRGLIKTISCGYDELFLMFLDAVSRMRKQGVDIGIQFHYANDCNVLDFALEYLKAKGLTPQQTNIRLGMSIANSHNFIRAQDYFTKERNISFVSFDDSLLIMNINLVDLENQVMTWTGEYAPLADEDDPEFRKGLEVAHAIVNTAMVKHGILLGVAQRTREPSVNDLRDQDIRGKVGLVRAGTDVLDKKGKIKSDKRIKILVPTIDAAFARGAKNLIVFAYFGRPSRDDKDKDQKYKGVLYDNLKSGKPIAERLEELSERREHFISAVNA